MWEDRFETGEGVSFDGIPFMSLGRNVLECHCGTKQREKQATDQAAVSNTLFV